MGEKAMEIISTDEILMIMAVVLFLMGVTFTLIGILILTVRVSGKDVRTLALQTTRLAQKGIAEDIAGLVGNASNLLSALNDMVRTTAGIGVFITVIGLILMVSASVLALKIP
jgi:hypothetical protein